MSKRFIGLLGFAVSCSLVASPVRASSLEVSGSGSNFGFGVAAALEEIELGTPLDLQASFGLSTRDLQARLKGNLDFGPAGQIGLVSSFGLLWQGGTRFQLSLDGTLGPIALEINAALWSGATQMYEPLAAFSKAEAFALEGISATFRGSYRLSRTAIVHLEPTLSSTGSRLLTQLEGRFGELTVMAGPLIGQARTGMIIAGMGTLRFSPEDLPFTLNGSALLGAMNSDLGSELALEISSGFEFNLADDEGNSLGTLSFKAEFANWRPYSLTGRATAGLELELGSGELLAYLGVGFGPTPDVPERFNQGNFGFGGSLGYRLRL